jgi:hypothetical protein
MSDARALPARHAHRNELNMHICICVCVCVYIYIFIHNGFSFFPRMRRLRAALHTHCNELHIQRETHTAIIEGVFFLCRVMRTSS